MENMETIWQQAELNTGTAHDLLKRIEVLRERLTGGAPEDVRSTQPDRPGLLGQLDANMRILRAAIDHIDFLSVTIGEHGVAPQVAKASGNTIGAAAPSRY